jgi:hypothetical protein
MKLYKTILKNCRPIYKLGMLVLKIGMVLAAIGLVVGLLGKAWMTFLIGIGCAVVGIFIGQVALISLTNEMKLLVEPLTAKQAHDLAAQHLQAQGDDVDDTEVFLGKFSSDMDWQEKQKRMLHNDT